MTDELHPDMRVERDAAGNVQIRAYRRDAFDPDEVDEPPIADHAGEPPEVERPIGTIAPDVAFAHGACTITWRAPHHIALEFDRFVNTKDELHAELVVRYTAPGLARQLYQARVNLMSARGRVELGNALSKSRRDVEWSVVLDTAVAAAVRAYRDGDPAILLRDAPLRLGTPHVLPPVLLREFPTILFGRGGDGKSMLALAMALAVHTGRPDLVGLRPSQTMRVLFLDWEFAASEHRERAFAMLAGAPLPDVAYLRCSDAIWDEVDRIRRAIREHRAEYLVIDSVGMACGGIPPESSEAALRFNAALRRLGLGALCVAHKVKDEATDDHPFGSIFWHNSARATWLVKRESEPDASPMVLGLYQKKANVGRRVSPLAFEVTIEQDELERLTHIELLRRDARDVPDVAAKLPVHGRMLRVLRSGPRSFVELAEELDEKVETVERAFRRHNGKTLTMVPSPDGIKRIALLAREDSA